MALSVGDKLGPYEIVEAIGQGGMGAVYRARDTRLGRTSPLRSQSNASASASNVNHASSSP